MIGPIRGCKHWKGEKRGRIRLSANLCGACSLGYYSEKALFITQAGKDGSTVPIFLERIFEIDETNILENDMSRNT